MVKKVAIRKLNRTLLKKEGTKQFYVTGKEVLMKLFGYVSMDDLESTQTENNKKGLFNKKEYYTQSNPEEIEVHITRANNEVRMTGEKLGEIMQATDITEVDMMVIENVINAQGEEVFLFDFVSCENMLVFQKYNKSDEENEELAAVHEAIFGNAYWMWDAPANNRMSLISNEEPFSVTFIEKNSKKSKQIRLRQIGIFRKNMKAVKRFQEKELFVVEENQDGEWVQTDFQGLNLAELVFRDDGVMLAGRNKNTWKYYEREVL